MTHHHQHHQHMHEQPKKKIHRNWLFTFAGILMLIAMVIYVLTLDESEVPGEPVPAVAAPNSP